MRKHGMLLTMIAAVLLVALCMGALELANHLLPNHQNIIEEISLPQNQSILTVNNREATSLYPWDIYESAKETSKLKPVASTDFENVYLDKRISQLIEIFSPWIMDGCETIEWMTKMEYLDDKENLFFFIKDVTFTDNLGDSYLVNIAFNDERLLYYACDRIISETFPAEIVASSYDKLNSDYTMFRDLFTSGKYGSMYDDAEAEEAVDSSASIFYSDENCFSLFIQNLSELEYIETEWNGLDPALADLDREKYTYPITSMIGEFGVSGMIYKHSDSTPNIMNVEFSQGDVKLVLFYDLERCCITGFSLKI